MLMYYAILVPITEDFIEHPRFQQDLNKLSIGLSTCDISVHVQPFYTDCFQDKLGFYWNSVVR